MAGVALVGVLFILHAWRLWPFNSAIMLTENSYVRGQMVVIAPQVNGYVTHVYVKDFEHVHQGDVLVQIDERTYRARVAQAQAQVESAQAQLNNVEQTLAQNRATLHANQAQLAAYEAEYKRAALDKERTDQLAGGGALTRREQDNVNATYLLAQANVLKGKAQIQIAQEAIKATEVSREGLKAQLEIARAQLAQAQIDLDNTTIRAPHDGQISEGTVRQGQYVSAGTQLMFLVPPQVWVVANYKETQTNNIRIGMRATFTVDALGGAKLYGHVEEIAPATGSEFSVLRPDNASGNFTKVVQRLPIRIAIDPDQKLYPRLRPGMSVVTSIDTAQKLNEDKSDTQIPQDTQSLPTETSPSALPANATMHTSETIPVTQP